MADYIRFIRELVGNRPIILCGAAVIVENAEGAILMQRRADNAHWGFPGGCMEMGESLEDTARRELFEEVRITAHGLTLLDVFSGPETHHIYPNGDEAHIVSVVYLCRDYEGLPAADSQESTEARFFSLDALPGPMNRPEQTTLARYLEYRSLNA